MDMADSWCSIDEIATYLAVRRETIYRWIKKRKFPAHKLGTVFKSRLSDVDVWVKTNGGEQSLFPDQDEELPTLLNEITLEQIQSIRGNANINTERTADFQAILQSMSASQVWKDDRNILLQGDSLSLLKTLPARSVSLIVTDPPYHSTKKDNIVGDTHFKDDEAYLQWMRQYIVEWKRVLRPNGSLYCFCSNTMSARLEVEVSAEFNVLSNITWTKPNAPGFDGWKQKMNKEALRQWYGHAEKIIFAEPAFAGNLFRSYFGNLLHDYRVSSGMTMKDLAEEIGAYGKVNHGGSIANWEAGRNIPSQEQYAKIRKALARKGCKKELPPYCDVIRPFMTSGNVEFTDVWNFPNIRPYKGKHPAEKPIALLEHIITTSSYSGDIVLDCFSGSGSTAIAALKNNRLAVSMEIDPQWIRQSEKIFQCINKSSYRSFPDNYYPVRIDTYGQELLL